MGYVRTSSRRWQLGTAFFPPAVPQSGQEMQQNKAKVKLNPKDIFKVWHFPLTAV